VVKKEPVTGSFYWKVNTPLAAGLTWSVAERGVALKCSDGMQCCRDHDNQGGHRDQQRRSRKADQVDGLSACAFFITPESEDVRGDDCERKAHLQREHDELDYAHQVVQEPVGLRHNHQHYDGQVDQYEHVPRTRVHTVSAHEGARKAKEAPPPCNSLVHDLLNLSAGILRDF